MFWHVYAKIPRPTSQNAITEGDFSCILPRNCEGTEQLRCFCFVECIIIPLYLLVNYVFMLFTKNFILVKSERINIAFSEPLVDMNCNKKGFRSSDSFISGCESLLCIFILFR